MNTGRAWRQQAGTLLIIFMVLAAATTVYGASSNAGRHLPGALMWLALCGFLAWRIWRYRSSGARDALLVFSALGMLLLIRAVFRWSPDLLGASGLFTAQFVLLLSPAIRRHVRAKPPRQHFPVPAQRRQDTEEGQPRAELDSSLSPGDASSMHTLFPQHPDSCSIQRMYDYPLGGKDNYTADRAAVEGLLKVWPDAFVTVRENRAFLSRAVRYLAISHGASDLLDQETWKGIGDSWNGRVQQQFIWRSRDQVARFFAGTDLVEPGLVPVEEWRPEPDSTDKAKPAGWGVVGRKR